MIPRAQVVAEYETKKYDESVWDSFKKNGRFFTEKRVMFVAVNHKLPYKYAIPKGKSVLIYKATNNTKHRRIAGFSKSVTCCNFRYDAKLLVGGEEGGILRFCTTDRNKYHLRKFQGHEGDIIHANFTCDGPKAITLGKDSFVKVWDVSLGELHSKFRVGHDNESPSCMDVGKTNPNLFCVGDFNGSIALYDLRQPNPAHKYTLPSTPSVLRLACDDTIVVSAAGQYVYTWDISTRKPFIQRNLEVSDISTHPGGYMHYKLITDLAVVHCPYIHHDPILLSVGMDKLLRITSLNTFEAFHQERLVSPCTALGAFPNLSHVVVGTESGLVRTFSFTTPTEMVQQNSSKRRGEIDANTDEPFAVIDPDLKAVVSRFSGKWRGINLDGGDKALTAAEWFEKSNTIETRIAPKDWGFIGSRAPLIHDHTKILRSQASTVWSEREREPVAISRLTRKLLRFQHSQALKEALLVRVRARAEAKSSTKAAALVAAAPLVVIAVVRELVRRGTLSSAISGQTVEELTRLLRFILKNIWRSRALPTFLHLFSVTSKLYDVSVLEEIQEYTKVRLLIRRLWLNLLSVRRLSTKMQGVLYPKEVGVAAPLKTADVTGDTQGMMKVKVQKSHLRKTRGCRYLKQSPQELKVESEAEMEAVIMRTQQPSTSEIPPNAKKSSQAVKEKEIQKERKDLGVIGESTMVDEIENQHSGAVTEVANGVVSAEWKKTFPRTPRTKRRLSTSKLELKPFAKRMKK